jgi:hypothetical protein
LKNRQTRFVLDGEAVIAYVAADYATFGKCWDSGFLYANLSFNSR